jgi:hypothetical protein
MFAGVSFPEKTPFWEAVQIWACLLKRGRVKNVSHRFTQMNTDKFALSSSGWPFNQLARQPVPPQRMGEDGSCPGHHVLGGGGRNGRSVFVCGQQALPVTVSHGQSRLTVRNRPESTARRMPGFVSSGLNLGWPDRQGGSRCVKVVWKRPKVAFQGKVLKINDMRKYDPIIRNIGFPKRKCDLKSFRNEAGSLTGRVAGRFGAATGARIHYNLAGTVAEIDEDRADDKNCQWNQAGKL